MKISNQEPTLAARVAALPKLPMLELWALWDKYFPSRPSHHHRGYVEGRVAYKLQEEALGLLRQVGAEILVFTCIGFGHHGLLGGCGKSGDRLRAGLS